MMLNRLDMVDLIEQIKIRHASLDDEKARAVIDSVSSLISYYDSHGWPKVDKKKR